MKWKPKKVTFNCIAKPDQRSGMNANTSIKIINYETQTPFLTANSTIASKELSFGEVETLHMQSKKETVPFLLKISEAFLTACTLKEICKDFVERKRRCSKTVVNASRRGKEP